MTICGALNELNDLLKADDIPIYYKPSIKAVMDTIALEQDVPKTGHWIEVIDEIDRFGNKTWHYECPICGDAKSGWGEFKYCPNCGARMSEVSK